MEDRLERIELRLERISEQVTELCTFLPEIRRRLERIETDVYGDGPGLKTRVLIIWSALPLVMAIAAAIGSALGLQLGFYP